MNTLFINATYVSPFTCAKRPGAFRRFQNTWGANFEIKSSGVDEPSTYNYKIVQSVRLSLLSDNPDDNTSSEHLFFPHFFFRNTNNMKQVFLCTLGWDKVSSLSIKGLDLPQIIEQYNRSNLNFSHLHMISRIKYIIWRIQRYARNRSSAAVS